MSSPTVPATIVVDLKKFRIRIHRPTLHAIGDPKLIQLLVNPEKRAVAIRAVGHEAPGTPYCSAEAADGKLLRDLQSFFCAEADADHRRR